jgi:hypothetical protein
LVRFQVSLAVLSKDKMTGLKRGNELTIESSTNPKKKMKTDSGSNSPVITAKTTKKVENKKNKK